MHRHPLQPSKLRHRYYQPPDQGFQRTIRDRLRQLRHERDATAWSGQDHRPRR